VTIDKFGNSLFVQVRVARFPNPPYAVYRPSLSALCTECNTAASWPMSTHITRGLFAHTVHLPKTDHFLPHSQTWRSPLSRREVRDLCDAAFGGQLVGCDDIERVWVHPRVRNVDAFDVEGFENDTDHAESFALAGVYTRNGRSSIDFSQFNPNVFGKDLSSQDLGFTFHELGLGYDFVTPRAFGDSSLFLDFRPTRRWVRSYVQTRVENAKTDDAQISCLNSFAYTCGAGLCATAGGATRVLHTDHSETYLRYGQRNYELNGWGGGVAESDGDGGGSVVINSRFESYCEDFYPAARQLAGLPIPGRQGRGGGRGGRGRGGRGGRDFRSASTKPAEKKRKPPKPETFDLVILDPPTFTKTAYGAVDIENDYQSLAKPASLCVTPGGVLIATNHSAKVGLDDWLEIVRRCATKAGCQVKRVEIITPDDDDDDHPAMADGKRPLKVAAFTLE
jgi:23S rRNA (cytosine1962-C5)-methyltransferase